MSWTKTKNGYAYYGNKLTMSIIKKGSYTLRSFRIENKTQQAFDFKTLEQAMNQGEKEWAKYELKGEFK